MKLGKIPSRRQSAFRRESALPGLKLLIVFVVLSFVMMTVYAREGSKGPLHAARGFVATLTAPVNKVGATIVRPVTGLGNIYRNATADEETLTELKEQNMQLRSAVERLEEYKQQSQRLEELLDIKNTYDLTSTAARVIGGSTDDWSRSIEIDKGSNEGIGINMPVLNSYGLIGQVVKVGNASATVKLITDENSGVAATIQSNRAQGIVRGAPDGSLKLDFITSDVEVKKGDVVITSGMGGVFPKGLPIGEVTTATKSPASLYYDITVKPPLSVSSSEEVLVITQLNDPEHQPIAAVKKSGTVEEEMAPLTPDGDKKSEGAGAGTAEGEGAAAEGENAEGASGEHQGTEGGQ